jgi:DNA topoisomerase-3
MKQVELGFLPENEFIDGIAEFTSEIIKTNNAPKPEFAGLFNSGKPTTEPLGLCPRCGSFVHEGSKGYFCDSRTCGFTIWRESKLWTARKKPLTAAIVAALLKDVRVSLKGLYSDKTGKKYDATVILDDTGSGFVNFKMEFPQR